MARPTKEMLEELRYDATWTFRRVGSPGCPARIRAAYLLQFLDDYERLLNEGPVEIEVEIDE